ncbi:UDP-glucosyl transferase 85A5 [Actinidia rufa]|uniref:UDP-glucosyl transferase 85A5 n=1 Tax=Actinidia rufa TaxID=165716 RepID=A0A7J0GGA1_9ERIC|nr:UDP-glucosyl transferase 85A5 [Actinidia rufa]
MGDDKPKPHVVCIPYPAQSHMKAMLKLAKLLHQKGSHITFVNTEYNHRRLLEARGPDSLQGLPDFQFQTIPDGLPPSDANATQHTYLLFVNPSAKIAYPHFLAAFTSSITDWTCLRYQKEDRSKSIGYNLWKEESECLQWLNSKELDSVVYVNFGSITIMTQQQLEEFGWGLANSHHNFLWIIRPDMVIDESVILPPELVAETKERGLIASWCPQEEVLNHPSVGGFLTHAGWNSTIESLSSGVPMLCLPFLADQQTNCRYICTEWEVGMEIDNDVKRDEVEKLVRELMDGEKGKKLQNKAREWRKLAAEAASPGGSSALNLNNLINKILFSMGG